MTWFWIGLSIGVLLTVPLAALAARRQLIRTRRLAQRARAAERLAELGTLTGGLAHEIKNPLSSVKMNLQLVDEDLADVANLADHEPDLQDRLTRTKRRFDSLTREVQRLHDILEDFLRFAGRMKLDLEPTDINELLNELADFFGPQAQASGVHVRTQLTAHPPTAPADAPLLKQAVLNLMINATQAMHNARGDGQPAGGNDELILRTLRSKQQGVEELRIHVTDTGPGIPPENAGKIFQPYFSTKKGGTGLGLPTARRIVEEHHGTLNVHSEPGRGTEFVIALPVNTVAEVP